MSAFCRNIRISLRDCIIMQVRVRLLNNPSRPKPGAWHRAMFHGNLSTGWESSCHMGTVEAYYYCDFFYQNCHESSRQDATRNNAPVFCGAGRIN